MTTLEKDFFILIAPHADIEETPVPGRRPTQPDELPDADDDTGSTTDDDWDDEEEEEYIYEHPVKQDPMV